MTTDVERIEALREVCRATIRALYRLNVTASEIAELTGLSDRTVYSMVRGSRGAVTSLGARTRDNQWKVTYPGADMDTARSPVRPTMTAEEEAAWLQQMSG